MAGMLPGVEAARRRRFHSGLGLAAGGGGGSAGLHACTRRHALGVSISHHDQSHTYSSASSSQRRSRGLEEEEKLGQLAREAKQRLDERLRTQTKSQLIRNDNDTSEETIVNGNGRPITIMRELQTEVYRSKRNATGSGSGSKRFSWVKLVKGKPWEDEEEEEEECVVCLEGFKGGDKLVSLACAHRFHSSCLLPWVRTHAFCPCCRTPISSL